MPKQRRAIASIGAFVASAMLVAVPLVSPDAGASSHREAPLISQDPAADITDMYVFRSPDAPTTVTAIMNVWPFQLPEGGPNWYLFDENVRYSMHITNDGDAEEELRLDFRFRTETRNPNTFLYNTGPVNNLTDETLNQRQFYSVDLVAGGRATRLGENIPVAPFNVGPKSFPNYDRVANQAVTEFDLGGGARGRVFAGPRDDPFYIDIGAAFDLLTIRPGPPGNAGGGVDQLAGYNVNTMAVQVPIAAVGRPECDINDPRDMDCVVGMWVTTSRPAQRVLRGEEAPTTSGDMVQVSRLSAALVNELVVPRAFKDVFNASSPNNDARFLPAVQDPEPARLLRQIYSLDVPPAPRGDIVTIFLTGIPELNQPPGVQPAEIAHLNAAMPVTREPNRLGVLGGDMQGYPNGRRLVDDVVDISLRAVAGGTPFTPESNKAPNNQLGDGVNENDRPFLSSFPYLAAPHQGFDHSHHRGQARGAAAPSAPAAQPAPAPQMAPSARPPAPPAAQPAALPRTGNSGLGAIQVIYTVQPGDTLSSISETVYGHPGHVDKIVGSNLDVLASEDHLQPGVTLVLPASVVGGLAAEDEAEATEE